MKIFNQNAELLAILDNIINPQISEEINGEYSLSFTTVIEEEKSQYINHNNYAEIENDYFQIMKYKKIRNSNNELLIDVKAEHKSYELGDYELTEFVYSGTPTVLLGYLLTDTPYTLLSCDIATIISIEIREKTNKRAILMEIAKAAAGELEYNKYNISLLQQRGQNRGTQLRVGKNLNGISIEIDNTQKVLGQPTTTYDVNIVELDQLEDFKGYETIATGDTVKVIDEDLGINTDLRIKRYSYNPLDRIESNINLSNVVKDVTDTIVNIKRDAVFKEVAYNGNVISPEVGFQSTRSDLKSRTTMSGTNGIEVERGDGLGGYTRIFYVNETTGDIIANDGTFNNITANNGTYNNINAVNMIATLMRTSNTSTYIIMYDQYMEFYKDSLKVMQIGFDPVNNIPTIKLFNSFDGGQENGLSMTGTGELATLGAISFDFPVNFYSTAKKGGQDIATLSDLSGYATTSDVSDALALAKAYTDQELFLHVQAYHT